MQKEEAIIVDIDGTIANVDHRIHLVRKPNKNWKLFFEKMNDDKPIEQIINKIKELHDDGLKILIVTGRPETYQSITSAWLNKHLPFEEFELIQRKKNDNRPSYQVKKSILIELKKKYKIKFFLDDKEEDINMYLNEGCQLLTD